LASTTEIRVPPYTVATVSVSRTIVGVGAACRQAVIR
jgi:hypothetical protein